jgi:hypothetical protein
MVKYMTVDIFFNEVKLLIILININKLKNQENLNSS